jgi:hypothetical protein
VRRYPRQQGGVISTTADAFIRTLYGLGLNECNPPLIPIASSADYAAGLADLRKLLMAESPRFGTYFVSGSAHICIDSRCFDTTQVGGVHLSAWVADLLTGTIRHLGP